jgi:hypothetical protein
MGRNSFVVDTIPDDDPEMMKLVELAKVKREISKERRKLKEKDFLNKHTGISKLYQIAKPVEPVKEEVKEEVKEPEPVKEVEPEKEFGVPVNYIDKPCEMKPAVINVIRADKAGRWF